MFDREQGKCECRLGFICFRFFFTFYFEQNEGNFFKNIFDTHSEFITHAHRHTHTNKHKHTRYFLYVVVVFLFGFI